MIVLLMAVGAAWAQGPAVPPKAPVKKAKPAAAVPAKDVKPVAATPVKVAPQKPAPQKAAPQAIKPAKEVKPAAAAAPAKAAKPATAAPAKQPKPAAAKKPVAEVKKPAAKTTAKEPAAQKPAVAPAPAKGGLKLTSTRRDPFVSPIVSRVAARPCATGKQCLSVGELVLKGVVRSQNGMLAVVENASRKAYFLRENDPVFNGFVLKISMDSIVLRENILDRLGNSSTRDVVKKITPAAVAVQGD